MEYLKKLRELNAETAVCLEKMKTKLAELENLQAPQEPQAAVEPDKANSDLDNELKSLREENELLRTLVDAFVPTTRCKACKKLTHRSYVCVHCGNDE